MTETDARALTAQRKRRGVVKASITRLGSRLKELESKVEEPATHDHAQRLATRLDTLDADFKTHHFALIDLIDDEETLGKEQEALDQHDDDVTTLAVCLQQLITVSSTTPTNSDLRKALTRKLQHLEKSLTLVSENVHTLSSRPEDVCRLQQHEEQLSDYKKDLADIRNSLLSSSIEEGDELLGLHSALEKHFFDCSLQIKELLQTRAEPRDPTPRPTPSDSKGVKLPRLDTPSFDGNILNWKRFWEQFCISVHDRSSLSDSEKLVYLQHALKDGSAKHVIEGLSRSGEHYAEAVKCLTSRYNRPRLIHQTHVKMVLETPPLKEGSGRELRRFHDTVQQHLRALKAMDYEPSPHFITSTLELKLDANTMFEWQKHSQSSTDVPHYEELLKFVDLRAQASETSVTEPTKRQTRHESSSRRPFTSGKPVSLFATNTESTTDQCVACKANKHPLYACTKFKSMSHDQKVSTLKANDLCLNCLGPGHFVKQCKSLHRCKKCQRPHHTALHIDRQATTPSPSLPTENSETPVVSNAAVELKSNSLLMTCRVMVNAPDGSSVEARAILDSASSASFISERLAQSLCLPRSSRNARISGIGGMSHKSPVQSITTFDVSAVRSSSRKIGVTAVVVPRVTCDLPPLPIPFNLKWNHLTNLQLADPTFNQPGRIDLLLGVDVFVNVLLHGRRCGPPGSPVAFETEFGWVLAGEAESCAPSDHVTTYHTTLISGDDVLRKFWEIEEKPMSDSTLSPEERTVVHHFCDNHSRSDSGRFIVPLPKKPDTKQIGESRSQAVRRFLSLERSLHAKNRFDEFGSVMQEYLDLGHAELVPPSDLEKPQHQVFYLPVHVVHKDSSTTTKIRAVFDASAKSSSNVSLNDTLLVGPTVHPPLVDVLLRFRLHRVALIADVSKMYRAVELIESDKDLHRFVWRATPDEMLQDYRMTRVTFGVSASSFAANMAVKQNAIDLAHKYPLAAKAVDDSFYVDDGLTGADSTEEAKQLQKQLHNLFSQGGFLLRKWNSNDPAVLQHLAPELKDARTKHAITDVETYTKTLGIEWNSDSDHFRLTIADLPPLTNVTKRLLVSDIARTFDVLGWLSPAIVKVKILLQRVWESKVDWDDPIPQQIKEAWLQWRAQLHVLSEKHIPRCYFSKESVTESIQLHGFSDASEDAYAGVIYLRSIDSDGNVHTSLVIAKTKVAPIKRQTIPRLELCGAHLLAQLLDHIKEVFHLSIQDIYAWTDSTIVLNWLSGNPRRFKTFVGNRVSSILELIPPDRWKHVSGTDNPADCASRGLFPSELLEYNLWWEGPTWLSLPPSEWLEQSIPSPPESSEEEKNVCLLTTIQSKAPIIPLDRYSSFTRLKRVTAWAIRFIDNCRDSKGNPARTTRKDQCLSVQELTVAENYWISLSQESHFKEEILILASNGTLPSKSCVLALHPFLDSFGVLRVGGRQQNSKLSFSSLHPAIVHGKHPVTKLIIRSEHLRLLHAGPALLTSTLSRRLHIVGYRKVIRSITRACVVCRRQSARPQPQMLGQLPIERTTPDSVFEKVGVDYAGPFYIKYGSVRKPTIVKGYVCIYVSLSVKAVHLELVSDLTSEAFIACLRRFVARRGKPSLIWSDHGTNFVGANRELKEFVEFLEHQKTQGVISEFCSTHNIQWRFIPERAPHFGGLWESAVRSMKAHLKRVVADTKLTFEEFMTVLTQIEACLNSRPLTSLTCDDDAVCALTPGHFLIGRPLESLPDPAFSYRSISLLRRWHLCQHLVRHFWQRWSSEYLSTLRKFTKWHHPSRNASIGDIVVLQEDGLVPAKWPLAKIVEVHEGKDGLVRVVTVKTHTGTYKRPIHKLALLLPIKN